MNQPKDLNTTAISKAARSLPHVEEVRFSNDQIEILFNETIAREALKNAFRKTFSELNPIFSNRVDSHQEEGHGQSQGVQNSQQNPVHYKEYNTVKLSIDGIEKSEIILEKILSDKKAEFTKNLELEINTPKGAVNVTSPVTGDLKSPIKGQQQG